MQTWSKQNLVTYSNFFQANKAEGDVIPFNILTRRLNYHSCAITSALSEMLVSFDNKNILFVCRDEKIRSRECTEKIDNSLSKSEFLHQYPSYKEVCNGVVISSSRSS